MGIVEIQLVVKNNSFGVVNEIIKQRIGFIGIELANIIAEQARNNTSGSLATNIIITPFEITEKEFKCSIICNVEYAEAVEDGSGIYGPNHTPIVAKNAKALHFIKDGKDIFVKSVKGQPPQFFMKKAVWNLEDNIGEIMGSILMRL